VLSRTRLVLLFCAVALGVSGCVSAQSIGAGSRVNTPPGHYLFADEFNGRSLDLSKWQPNWLGPDNGAVTKPVNGAERSCYDPSQVHVPGDGYLHLTAVARSCRANNGSTYSYASGLVNTYRSFRFTDGYLEARVWLPGGSSIKNWPAVWTDGTGTWPSTGESDVMEGLSGKACFHYHSPSGGPGGCAPGSFTGWHTFAEDVHNGVTKYYYDGRYVGTMSSVRAPHYVILNLGVGGYGGDIEAPSQMLVDYVRVRVDK
jgi:beta-glucanase (GH16 family)